MNRSLIRSALSLFVVWALASAVVAHDARQLYDSTFGPGMTSQKVVDTTPGATATYSAVTNFGTFGWYREVSQTFGNGSIVVAHWDPQFQHDPADQPICSIDFQAQMSHLTAPTVGGAVAVRPCVIQGGVFYGGPTFNVVSASWTTFGQNLLKSTDFTIVAGLGLPNPDFSCSGSVLDFGFLTANSSGGATVTKVVGVDEWIMELRLNTRTVQDGTMNNWTWTRILDTTPGAAATAISTNPSSGGSPGAYRETSQTWSDGAVVVGHINVKDPHSPNPEQVYAYDFSADLAHLTATTVGGAVAVRPALRQGTTWYGGASINVFSGAWTHYTQDGITSADFTRISGPGPLHPDFSYNGDVLLFGYVTATSASGGPTTKVLGADNVRMRAQLAPACTSGVGNAACFGNDSTNPCPCFPTIPVYGPAGRGCPNSVDALGARLTARGTPSLANDSLFLYGTGLPNSSCLYFQGTTLVTGLLGDGKRCAGGTTIRLGTKTAVCNASQFPAGWESPISVQGSITSPGQRHYQIWYRNSAVFCTSATFNLTNSLTISWAP